jgi:dihydrodipicolinate synthase/N-acetylneuraminate lyase
MKKIIVAAIMCAGFIGAKSVCMNNSQDFYRQLQAAEQQRQQEKARQAQAAAVHTQWLNQTKTPGTGAYNATQGNK